MSGPSVDHLEKQLEQLFGGALPDQAVHNINAAMKLAGILEAQGFTFQLKDMCPRSLNETNWRAAFSKEDAIFSAEDPRSSVAVCMAAVDALAGP